MENCIIENSPTSIEDFLSYYSTMKTTENNVIIIKLPLLKSTTAIL